MNIVEEYPCGFCGWIDGEHANGCPYEHRYDEDIGPLQEEKVKQSGPKYPEVEVQLSREDGNALAILSRIVKELRKIEVSNEEIQDFRKEAMSGDYDNLLQVCMKWVTTF